jgi:acyl-coenzyme A thioesterase 13
MSNPILQRLKKEVNKPITKSVSPSSLWMKGRLLNIEEGYAVISYKVRKEMTNPIGTIQGGVMAALIDDTMGLAFYSLFEKNMFTTTNLNVNYLFGAREGELVKVEAKVVRIGKKIANMECKVFNSNNDIISTATSNLVVTSIKIEETLPDKKADILN